MKFRQTLNHIARSALSVFALLAMGVQAAPTQLSNAPLSGASSVEILPNLMFVLDDSLSMSWDYLPDWAGGKNNTNPLRTIPIALWQSRNSSFNGIAYNPALTYLPPVYFNSDASVNTTTYPSQTAANTSNWTAVKRNPYLGSSTDNLVGSAFYYTTVPGEYCANASLKSCSTTATSFPAKLRWCSSAAQATAASPTAGACQATQINNEDTVDRFGYPRMPSPRASTISIGAAGSVSSITVDGKQILSAAVPAQPDAASLATAVADSINVCSFGAAGATWCQVVGYRAAATGSTLVIYSPNVSALTPAVTASPSLTASAFARPADNLAPGENLLTVITSTTTSYPKASTRSDCVGATCTYDEEMTNYANWHAYYRTRMQTMKSAASRAFAPLGNTYRVGLMSINNKTGESTMGDSYLNVGTFSPTQKLAWYNKLFNAVPNGETPLRKALSTVGLIYAGKLTGSFNGHDAIVDPVQFSCQQNVSILSTDGYWNDAAGYKIDKSAVGDQDGPDVVPTVERPQLDGGAPAYARSTTQITKTVTPTVPTQVQMKVDTVQSQQRKLQISTLTQRQSQSANLQETVSTLQVSVKPLQSSTSQLRTRTQQLQQQTLTVPTISTLTQWQSRTAQITKQTLNSQVQRKTQALQKKESALQRQTATLQKSTSTLLSSTSQLQERTSQLQRRVTQVQKRTSTNSGATWSAWSDVASCIPVVNESECRLLAVSGWSNVTSCTPVAAPASNPETKNPGTDSQYLLYTTVSECQYGAVSTWSNATSCTTAAKSSGTGTWSVGTARDCQYTAWTTPATATTCTPLAQSTASPYSVGTATACSYSPWTTYANVTSGTCVKVDQSTGGGTWSVATATACQYSGWSAAATVTSCTNVEKSTASPYSVLTATQCSYAAWPGSWSASSAPCNPAAQSAASTTTAMTGPARQCRYNPTISGWTNVASCTKSTATEISNFSVAPAIVDCQTIDVWSAPVNAASCTANATTLCPALSYSGWNNVASCTPGTSGTGVVTECQQVWTTPVATGSCTPSATVTCGLTWSGWSDVSSCVNDGATSRCQYSGTWSGYSNVSAPSTCTVQNASSGSGTWVGPMRECSYTDWTVAANDAACSKLDQSTGTTTGSVWTVNVAKRCSYPTSWGPWVNATASCSPQTESTANPYAAEARQCRYLDSGPTVVSSCSPVTKSATAPYSVLVGRSCGYSGFSAWADVPSCTAIPASTSAPYVATAVNCNTVWTAYSDTTSCTTDASTRCQYGTANWVKTPGGCTLLPASTSSPYTVGTATVACNTTPVSPWTNTVSCVPGANGSNDLVSCQTVLKPVSGPTPVDPAGCTDSSDDGTPEHSTIACTAVTTAPTKTATCTAVSPSSANSWVRTDCAESTEGPTSDTLADVAQYYYMTDLRTPALGNCTVGSGENVCTNNVLPSGDSRADWQHMTTYTLGLGASGLMQYNKNYMKSEVCESGVCRPKTVLDDDFYAIRFGSTADTSTGVCSWQTRGTCNWPKPVSNTQTNIDDLWHAAVNGRGTYFSASDPESLAASISSALASIGEKPGALAAVSVASANLVAGENAIFESSFRAGEWSGDLAKRTINGTTGEISSATATGNWSAQALLDARSASGRTIYTYNPGGKTGGASDPVNNLKYFTWLNLSAGEQDYFQKPHIAGLSQFCGTGAYCLSSTTQTAASGEPLLEFIRGVRTNEGAKENTGTYYRQRTHVLGDIVNSEAQYVKAPPWNYADFGYAAFKTAQASRTAMVYVGANDGMLHAFNAADGSEAWAYVPKLLMPNLYRLADKSYSSTSPVMHRFFVDGSPVMGDICTANCSAPTPPSSTTATWKTILVGGFNNGGRGYYALDITDPSAPQALWEFSDDNLGYSYGNPVVTKLKDGTWVVMFASGYNNASPGDGQGRLFILNANTGAVIRTIATGVGSTSTPSGLSKITAWANFPDSNNTAQRVYGGDLQGNLWRFDVNGDIPSPAVPPSLPVYDAQRLATLKDSGGVVQPITTRVELGKVKNYPVVFVGTGQLLGTDDLSTSQTQSLYAIKDRLIDADYGSPRPLTPPQTSPVPGSFVAQTLTTGTCAAGSSLCTEGTPILTSSNNPVDLDSDDGWYFDFVGTRERVNVDPKLVLGTLAVNTNAPQSGSCVPVGIGYSYFFDYRTGGSVDGTEGVVGVKLGDFLVTAPAPIRFPDGTIKELTRTDFPSTKLGPLPVSPSAMPTRRISWRELVTE